MNSFVVGDARRGTNGGESRRIRTAEGREWMNVGVLKNERRLGEQEPPLYTMFG